MSFPTVAVVDDFNRANGTVGSSWSKDTFAAGSGTAAVAGSEFSENSTGYVEYWYNAASYANTNGLECENRLGTVLAAKAAVSSLNGDWVTLCQQPGSAACDAYQVGAIRVTGTGTDRVHAYRYDNAVPVKIIDVALGRDWVAGVDKIGLEVTLAGAINAYVNGTLVGTAIDLTYFHAGQSAFGGVALSGTGNPSLDDFRVGQTVSSGASDSVSPGGATGAGVIPTVRIVAPVGGGVGQGVTVAAATATTAASSLGQGTVPTARTTTDPGGSGGAAPSVAATAAISAGSAVGAGSSPGEQISGGDTAPAGGSVGAGRSPAATVTATAGGAQGQASPPAATATAGTGAATGGAPAPTTRASCTIATSMGAGNSPSVAELAAQASSAAGGAAPASRVPAGPAASVGAGRPPADSSSAGDIAPAGSAIGGGTSPSVRIAMLVAGATGQGVAFVPSATFNPGAAAGAGTGPPGARYVTTTGGAGAQGIAPGALVPALPASSTGQGVVLGVVRVAVAPALATAGGRSLVNPLETVGPATILLRTGPAASIGLAATAGVDMRLRVRPSCNIAIS